MYSKAATATYILTYSNAQLFTTLMDAYKQQDENSITPIYAHLKNPDARKNDETLLELSFGVSTPKSGAAALMEERKAEDAEADVEHDNDTKYLITWTDPIDAGASDDDIQLKTTLSNASTIKYLLSIMEK